MVNSIHDVRQALDRPDLAIVIGELGNGGEQSGAGILAIRKAQASAAARPEFKGRVAFVRTGVTGVPPG